VGGTGVTVAVGGGVYVAILGGAEVVQAVNKPNIRINDPRRFIQAFLINGVLCEPCKGNPPCLHKAYYDAE
jgi:hypothetical protein